MQLSIRPATGQDIDAVIGILREADAWLEQRGMPLWRQAELESNEISAEVRSGLFFLAECDGEPDGTVRVHVEDKLFWPDVPQDDSAFVHRLAVRRRFAGGEVSCEPYTRASDFTFTATSRWVHISLQDTSTTWGSFR